MPSEGLYIWQAGAKLQDFCQVLFVECMWVRDYARNLPLYISESCNAFEDENNDFRVCRPGPSLADESKDNMLHIRNI